MAVPIHSLLFTIDINSLYTNINTVLGLKTVSSIFNQYPDKHRPDSELLQLLSICLNNNDFLFNNNHFLQVSGTAMGQRYAPSYANIYMSEWEREALAKCPHKPSVYLRYLDDIFGIWPHDAALFSEFINILNNHHPSITVTYILNAQQVNFLDTTVFFQQSNNTQNRLLTKVYFKDTDTHALLHKASYHPKHTFKGIIKSQIIRFYRISSKLTDFHTSTQILFRSLTTRGYGKRFLRTIKTTTLSSLAPARSCLPDTQLSSPVSGMTWPPPPTSSKSLSSPSPHSPYPNQGLYPNPNPPPITPNPNSYPYPGVGGHPNRRTINPSTLLQPHSTPMDPQQIIPFVSTFSHRITGLHHTIKQNFLQHPPSSLIISGLESNDRWTTGQRKRAEKVWIERLGTTVPRGLNDT
ncbi:uncharacterized protein LOC115004773 [Cottoperca gobio]|nr:uncharacterized protein LOC115004773 [Cottoperca gobio]